MKKTTSQRCLIVKVFDEQCQCCINSFTLKLKFKKGSACSNSNLPRRWCPIWFNKFNDMILDMSAYTMSRMTQLRTPKSREKLTRGMNSDSLSAIWVSDWIQPTVKIPLWLGINLLFTILKKEVFTQTDIFSQPTISSGTCRIVIGINTLLTMSETKEFYINRHFLQPTFNNWYLSNCKRRSRRFSRAGK